MSGCWGNPTLLRDNYTKSGGEANLDLKDHNQGDLLSIHLVKPDFAMNRAGLREDRMCHTCDRTFSKKEYLTRHIRAHKQERPFECSICGKLYPRNYGPQAYLANQHSY